MPRILQIETLFGSEKHLVELDDVQGTCGLFFLTVDNRYVGVINSTQPELHLHFHNRCDLLYADEIQILLDLAADYIKKKGPH